MVLLRLPIPLRKLNSGTDLPADFRYACFQDELARNAKLEEVKHRRHLAAEATTLPMSSLLVPHEVHQRGILPSRASSRHSSSSVCGHQPQGRHANTRQARAQAANSNPYQAYQYAGHANYGATLRLPAMGGSTGYACAAMDAAIKARHALHRSPPRRGVQALANPVTAEGASQRVPPLDQIRVPPLDKMQMPPMEQRAMEQRAMEQRGGYPPLHRPGVGTGKGIQRRRLPGRRQKAAPVSPMPPIGVVPEPPPDRRARLLGKLNRSFLAHDLYQHPIRCIRSLALDNRIIT